MTTKTTPRAIATLILTLAALISPATGVRAQTSFPRDTLLAAARDIMDAARYCALITASEPSVPGVREMDPFSPGEDMTVWLGTDRRSRKVQEIRRDPRVVLYYPAPGALGYVTIVGRAVLVDDEGEKAARWKPEWGAFYPDRASDYLLIKVVPERLEVIDYSRGIVGDPRTWEPPSVVFR